MTERIAKKRLVRGHDSCPVVLTGIIENFLAFELVYFLMDGYGIRNFEVLLRSRARVQINSVCMPGSELKEHRD